MVILVHSRQLYPGLSDAFDIFMFGQMGCQIFFVASGFLIAMSYCRSSNIKSFYCKRFFSLAPGYWFMVILMTALTLTSEAIFARNIGFCGNTDPVAIVSNLLLINGLIPNGNNDVVGGGWYIGTTVVLYALYPVLNKWFEKWSNKKAVIPFCIAVFQAMLILLLYAITGKRVFITNNSFIYFNFINQTACFALGILLYHEMYVDKIKCDLSADLMKSIALLFVAIGLFYNENQLVFAFITSIVGYAAFYLTRVMINCEMKDSLVGTSRFSTILEIWGKRSLYIFLTHTFFVFSMPRLAVAAWRYLGKPISIEFLYLCSLIIMFGGTWILSKYVEGICQPLSLKLIRYFVIKNKL